MLRCALDSVLPEDAQVVAEVAIDNKDIGFVREGQAAAIKLETFPFTRFGTVPAVVRTVSADAMVDERKGAVFKASLLLGSTVIQSDGGPVRISPGMNVTAEIKTGHRRLLDYVLEPVRRHAQEGLRER